MVDLKDANENPWYVLMTLYGEQDGGANDKALHERNRIVWNAWSCQNLNPARRAELLDHGVEVAKRSAWQRMEAEVRIALKARSKTIIYEDLPTPGEAAVLSGFVLSLRINLERMVFPMRTKFDGAVFLHEVHAAGAAFLNGVDFKGATFDKKTSFNSTNFFSSSVFVSANFKGAANFYRAKFIGPVDFHSAHFDKRARFIETIFEDKPIAKLKRLNFSDTQFDQLVSFRGAIFSNRFPDFSGAMLGDTGIFPWEDANWPEETEQDRLEARDACAFLRHHGAKQGLPEAEQFFFKREMKFAEQVGAWHERLPYRFYGLISDYGSSIAKPIYGLLGLWVIPALIYFAYFSWLTILPISDGYVYWNWDAFGYSFANIFKFFGFQRTYFTLDFIAALPSALKFLSAAQTVVGYIFLFFLGLGLRSRFRLR